MTISPIELPKYTINHARENHLMAAPKLKWTDSLEIAIQLTDAHPDVDPAQVRFTALMNMVLALPSLTTTRSTVASAFWRPSSKRGSMRSGLTAFPSTPC